MLPELSGIRTNTVLMKIYMTYYIPLFYHKYTYVTQVMIILYLVKIFYEDYSQTNRQTDNPSSRGPIGPKKLTEISAL